MIAMESVPAAPGWLVSESLALELNLVLTWALRREESTVRVFDPAINELLATITPEWRAQWAELMHLRGQHVGVLEDAAVMAGQLFGTDYGAVTLAIRELTLAAALEYAINEAAQVDVQPDRTLPLEEQFIDVRARAAQALYTISKIEIQNIDARMRQLRRDLELCVLILRDGELHSRFWFLLDQFYFEFYRPWRAGRQAVLDQRWAEARGHLKVLKHSGAVPPLGWLPPQNPLLRFAELGSLMQRLPVVFWVEPLGMFDLVTLLPELMLVSFAPTGSTMQSFRRLAEEIAVRTQALADPTRLSILRLIRHLPMNNTDIAEYLEIARPTVSVHAKILREAGLITTQPDGRQVRHTLVGEEIRRLFADLEQFLALNEFEDD